MLVPPFQGSLSSAILTPGLKPGATLCRPFGPELSQGSLTPIIRASKCEMTIRVIAGGRQTSRAPANDSPSADRPH